jgi:hypothetical protein
MPDLEAGLLEPSNSSQTEAIAGLPQSCLHAK